MAERSPFGPAGQKTLKSKDPQKDGTPLPPDMAPGNLLSIFSEIARKGKPDNSVQLTRTTGGRAIGFLKQEALEEAKAEPDPLATHIFVSRRQYRNMPDTKSGKRHVVAARMSWQTACELGFRGSLGEWERLLGAAPKR